MLYLNLLILMVIDYITGNLTLTNVVFESFFVPKTWWEILNLTLTNVVFEFRYF